MTNVITFILHLTKCHLFCHFDIFFYHKVKISVKIIDEGAPSPENLICQLKTKKQRKRGKNVNVRL